MSDVVKLVMDIAGLVGGLAALVAIVYIALNRGLVENYKATVESQNARISSLVDENTGLRERVAKLEGERDGYELAAKLMVEAITTAGICAKAWHCQDRIIPTPKTAEGAA